MKFRIIKKFKILFFVAVFSAVPVFVHAFEIKYPRVFGLDLNETSSFPEYARYFFTLGIAVATSLAALVIVFGGLYYLISFGGGKYSGEGKEWVKSGLLGLFLILGSYLIVYTINPDLVIFRLDGLKPIIFSQDILTPPFPGRTTTTYQEIPVGRSTEKVLTKQIGCYAFDQNGNPVKGKYILATPCQDSLCAEDSNLRPEWIDAPTFLKNDRVDCVIKLEAGIKAKLKQIKEEVTDKVIDLTKNNCSCHGDAPDSKDNVGILKNNFFSASVLGSKSEAQTDPQNCKPGAGCDINNQPCSDYKGPCAEDTPVTNDNCSGNCKKRGCEPPSQSDTLCCQNPEDTRKGIEDALKKLKPDPNHSKILADLEKSYKYDNDDGYISVIDLDNWDKLNLGEQFFVLTGRMNRLKENVENDSRILASQANQLSRCYFSTSSVDLMNIIKQTNQQNNLILVNGSGESKYCKAFNYSNSGCYKKCQDICPDSQDSLSCYNNGPECTGAESDFADCLKRQQKWIGDCLNKKPCENSPFADFGECLSSCGGQCQDQCQKIYPENSEEFALCQDQCQSDSKCLLENAASCLYSPKDTDKCSDAVQNNDKENLDYCINRSYLCKYGSYQNAGYADCANGYGCSETKGGYPPFLKSNLFSASYLFKNQNKERCGSNFEQCFLEGGVKKSCTDIYPETAKCPTSSDCPSCPCTSVANKTLRFELLPAQSACGNNSNNNAYSIKIDGYQIVGPECGEYAQNGDPLTFYCKNSWWNDSKEERETPIGKERFCPKNSEVPVGQTIDDTQKWAGAFIQKIDDFMKVIKDDVSKPLEKIQEQVDNKDYCKCNSKKNKDPCCKGENCEQEPACFTDCEFKKAANTDESGNVTGYDCSCNFSPCQGNPCQEIDDLLSRVSDAYNSLIEPYAKLVAFYINDERSDVLKELTYSREKTNQCSVVINSYGKQVKLLNCQRVEDELIPPTNTNASAIINGKEIKNYCYGEKLGKLFNMRLNDNWFCCQMYNEEQ